MRLVVVSSMKKVNAQIKGIGETGLIKKKR